MSGREHVLVVGGGFSGTLLAINLLRHDGPRVTLVERRASQVARGVAYSAADDSHLLNVRAANMSALPDDPDHFVRWLVAEGEGCPSSFVRRTTYGRYLNALLTDACAGAGDRFVVETGDVSAVEANGSVRAVIDGAERRFDRAVLAVGNLPPHAPPGIDAASLPRDLYCDDPWAADIGEGLREDAAVLLLGTGLTAIDAALLLDRQGFRGRIVAMSRRGLVPRAHVEEQAKVPPADEKPARTLAALVHAVRDQATVAGEWRAAVDALRPVTQLLWAGADLTTRERFLRHLRPFWDVHRHRLAPQVAARIDAMVAEGRLSFQAGKLAAIRPEGDGGLVEWRPRGADTPAISRFRRIVNCTGPQGDLKRAADPLLCQLMAAGAIRPDAARLGIDVAADTRVIGADGQPADRLYAIGPMTRGAWWEVVAVPDIRVQAWNLARTLANAHWVGGEGL